MFEVGTGPYEFPDVAALNRQLAAMCMSIPADLGAALWEEQSSTWLGSWGNHAERWRTE